MNILLPNIFGKPFEEIRIDDVIAFCEQQVKEGINLDYKKDLSSSKSIVKAIAAFGNTRGGWIIVGVDDKDDMPITPAVGMDYSEHLELSITNMAISHMSPPLIPVIHVCPPDTNNKTFMLLYVPESSETPHWLFNKRELYIRVAQRTDHRDWERFATSDEWEWLRKKREKSEGIRNSVKKALDDYFLECTDKGFLEKLLKRTTSTQFLPTLSKQNVKPRKGTEGMLNLSISPTFPQDALLSVKETYDKLDDIAVQDAYATDYRFPISLNNRFVYQKGTIAYESLPEENQEDEERKYFTALDMVGMLVYKESVLFKTKPAAESDKFPEPYVEFNRFVVRFQEFLTISSNLYSSITYGGLLTLNIHLHGESWMKMVFPSQIFHPKTSENPNNEFIWEKTFLAGSIKDEHQREELLKEIIENLMYAFGWKDFNWNIFETTMKQFYPPSKLR